MTSRKPYMLRRVAARRSRCSIFQVLKNAKELEGLNAEAFGREIGVPASYRTEFTKMISLAILIEEQGARLVLAK